MTLTQQEIDQGFVVDSEGNKRRKCSIWTRIMGYHRPILASNHGKRSEHFSRAYFVEPQLEENKDFNSKYALTSCGDACKISA